MGRCLLCLRDRKKAEVAEEQQISWGAAQKQSETKTGPDGHGKKFNFYLKGYVKLLESYKESQVTFII